MGVEFTFFDALDLRSDASAYYSPENPDNVNARNLTNGEVGCAVSHLEIYKDIIENEYSSALVLEDDAIFDEKLFEFVEQVTHDKFYYDVVLLGYSKMSFKDQRRVYMSEPIKVVKRYAGVAVGKVYKNSTTGTVGYLVSLAGAKKLVNANPTIITMSDDWYHHSKKSDLDVYHVHPNLVFEDFENFVSSLESERKKVSHGTVLFRIKHYLKLTYKNRFLKGLYKLIMVHLNFHDGKFRK